MKQEAIPEKMPEDLQAERSLLATLGASGNDHIASRICPTLEEKDFVHPKHRAIFSAIASLASSGVEISALTIKDVLGKQKHLGTAGGFQGIIDVLRCEEVDRPEILAGILKKHRALRQLMELSGWMLRATDGGDYIEIVGKAQNALKNILERNTEDKTRSAYSTFTSHILNGKAFSSANHGVPVAETGITWADREAKIVPGTVTVIGARMGVGKTTLAIQTAVNAARQGCIVLFFSLEMPEPELVAKIMSYASKTPVGNLMKGEYRFDYPEDYEYLENIKIVEGYAGYPWGLIEAETQKVKPDVLVIDYLEYVKPMWHGKTERADLGWANVSLALTGLTKRLKIATILLAQLHRLEEGHEPHEANLAQTDQVAKDASNILLLFRNREQDIMLKVAKARYGQRTSARRVEFKGDINTFEEKVLQFEAPKTKLQPARLRLDTEG